MPFTENYRYNHEFNNLYSQETSDTFDNSYPKNTDTRDNEEDDETKDFINTLLMMEDSETKKINAHAQPGQQNFCQKHKKKIVEIISLAGTAVVFFCGGLFVGSFIFCDSSGSDNSSDSNNTQENITDLYGFTNGTMSVQGYDSSNVTTFNNTVIDTVVNLTTTAASTLLNGVTNLINNTIAHYHKHEGCPGYTMQRGYQRTPLFDCEIMSQSGAHKYMPVTVKYLDEYYSMTTTACDNLHNIGRNHQVMCLFEKLPRVKFYECQYNIITGIIRKVLIRQFPNQKKVFGYVQFDSGCIQCKDDTSESPHCLLGDANRVEYYLYEKLKCLCAD